MTAKVEVKKVSRADGFANFLTKLGTSGDKSSYTGFLRGRRLMCEELEAVYEEDPLAKRIVDRLVDDGTREGFFLTGTDEAVDFSELLSDFENLDALKKVATAWRWARLYGGSILLVNVNDGLPMNEPMDLDSATKILSMHPIACPHIHVPVFDPALGSAAFMEPEFYEATVPVGVEAEGEGSESRGIQAGSTSRGAKRIHKSRVVRFDGNLVPPSRLIKNGGWGPSVIDGAWSALKKLGTVMGYAENVMHEISVMKMAIKGFRDMACGTDKDQTDLRTMMETIKWANDTLHMMVTDAEDEYGEVSRSVAGLDALIERFVDGVVRATDMPRTVLLGEQPGGLNANGDSEIRAWFDFVSAQQGLQLQSPLNQLLHIYFATLANSDAKVPDEWTINFNPLWQPTRKESAETLKTMAESASILIELGVVSADEVREQLISAGLIEALEAPSDGGGET